MKGILSNDKQTIKGPVTMDVPSMPIEFDNNAESGAFVMYERKLKWHDDHLAFLPSLPAIGFEGHEPGLVEYVEGECSCNSAADCPYGKGKWFPCTVAIPAETRADLSEDDAESFRLLEEYDMEEKLAKTIHHALTKVPENNRENFIVNLCNGMIGSAILHHHNRYVKKINVPDFKVTFK